MGARKHSGLNATPSPRFSRPRALQRNRSASRRCGTAHGASAGALGAAPSRSSAPVCLRSPLLPLSLRSKPGRAASQHHGTGQLRAELPQHTHLRTPGEATPPSSRKAEKRPLKAGSPFSHRCLQTGAEPLFSTGPHPSHGRCRTSRCGAAEPRARRPRRIPAAETRRRCPISHPPGARRSQKRQAASPGTGLSGTHLAPGCSTWKAARTGRQAASPAGWANPGAARSSRNSTDGGDAPPLPDILPGRPGAALRAAARQRGSADRSPAPSTGSGPAALPLAPAEPRPALIGSLPGTGKTSPARGTAPQPIGSLHGALPPAQPGPTCSRCCCGAAPGSTQISSGTPLAQRITSGAKQAAFGDLFRPWSARRL